MKDIASVKPLSDALSSPIIKAYRAGGLGLVFIFVGTLLLLAALFFGQGIIGYGVGLFGSLMILPVLSLFYFQSIKPLKELQSQIKRNREIVDTVQQTALQMTDLAYNLQSLAFKNANMIVTALIQVRKSVKAVTALPFVSSIPGIDKVGELADNEYVIVAEDLSTAIVETTESMLKVIEDLQSSLVESDPKALKKYLVRIRELDLQTKNLLKK